MPGGEGNVSKVVRPVEEANVAKVVRDMALLHRRDLVVIGRSHGHFMLAGWGFPRLPHHSGSAVSRSQRLRNLVRS